MFQALKDSEGCQVVRETEGMKENLEKKVTWEPRDRLDQKETKENLVQLGKLDLQGPLERKDLKVDSLQRQQVWYLFLGEPGLPGDAGLNGAPGEKGEPGMKGEKGARGLRGFLGPPGINGSKGEPGVGIKGDAGLPAINGSKGEKGAKGINGTKGEKGAACNITSNEGNNSSSNSKRSIFTKEHQRINNGDDC